MFTYLLELKIGRLQPRVSQPCVQVDYVGLLY